MFKLAGENREDEVDDDDEHARTETTFDEFVPSPLIPLKAALEKDKDDESLRRWKEKLLGRVESDLTEQMEPEVTFLTIGIISDELGEINTPLPVDETKSRDVLFALRENSEYQLKLTFTVGHNIVSGLAYTNTVWRYGVQVDGSKGHAGYFCSPARTICIHTLKQKPTPSGVLARGIYSAKLKVKDDDKRCHMELKYCFEIRT
ncbi:rho GDP-dissociation inhibitor 1-like [Impatiens glandulifera]|uniref:rho GDP-dissociation inhibitor 1-like n=1 Tax=Impatiens glandulifera TaxID=253017 RepID=UPI001FB0B022|nr:rho GDP-dissociation inhibitor 1-like [Impatiens glandulifera]